MFLPRVPKSLFESASPPKAKAPTASLRFLGTAGFAFESKQHTVVLDPFLTRPSELRTLFSPLRPDVEKIKRHVPRANDVLVGHAHHDHALDAPDLCRLTGARLIGSPDVCNLGRAAGLPESQLVETVGGTEIASGHGSVQAIPSKHGRVYFNRVTLKGNITSPPTWPAHFTRFRHGLVLNWMLNFDGLRIIHIDSAEFIEQHVAHAVKDEPVDVLCLCAIGRRWRPNYVAEAVALMRPRFVVPCHWDWFFRPLDQPPVALPGVDLPGFIEEIRSCNAQPVLLPFGAELQL